MNKIFGYFKLYKSKNTNNNNDTKSNTENTNNFKDPQLCRKRYSDTQINYSLLPSDGENEAFVDELDMKINKKNETKTKNRR